MHEKLKSNLFSEYLKALDEVRHEVEEGKIDIDKEDFENILKIYEWYKYDFIDIKEITNNVLNILEENFTKLNDNVIKKHYEGLKKYTKQSLNHKYDGTGFPKVTGNLEISALVAIDELMLTMDKSLKDHFNKFEEYKKILKRIEGCYHLSYRILKIVGNKYIDSISSLIFSIPESMQTYILHSLDSFKKDQNVVQFFDNYLNKVSALKNEAEKFLKDIKQKK